MAFNDLFIQNLSTNTIFCFYKTVEVQCKTFLDVAYKMVLNLDCFGINRRWISILERIRFFGS